MDYKVIVGWDEENKVFYVVESDVEGLWLEKATFEGLVDAIRDTVGELLSHNRPADKATPTLRIFREMGAPMPITFSA